jgi:hypothetical protein
MKTGRLVLEAMLGAVAMAAILSAAGCSTRSAASTSTTDVIPVPAPVAASAPAVPQASAAGVCPAQTQSGSQVSMDVGATKPLMPQPALDARIARLSEQHGSKRELAAVYVQRGTARMMDPQAAPHLKYPAALSDFREAMRLDPANQIAAGSAQLIEEIYRGLGKPVPTN